MLTVVQNRRRKYNRDGDDADRGRDKTPDFEDKLKEATTLYVGNLYMLHTIYALRYNN